MAAIIQTFYKIHKKAVCQILFANNFREKIVHLLKINKTKSSSPGRHQKKYTSFKLKSRICEKIRFFYKEISCSLNFTHQKNDIWITLYVVHREKAQWKRKTQEKIRKRIAAKLRFCTWTNESLLLAYWICI